MPASGHLDFLAITAGHAVQGESFKVRIRCWCHVHPLTLTSFSVNALRPEVEALPDRPSSSGLGVQGPCQLTPAHTVLANRCLIAWCQTARSLERSSSSDQPSSLSCLRYAPQFSVGALPIPSGGTLLREVGTWPRPQQCSGQHLHGDSSFSLTI